MLEIIGSPPQILFKFLFGFVQLGSFLLYLERLLGVLTQFSIENAWFMLDAFLDVPIPVLLNLPLPLDGDVFSLVQPHIRLVLARILKLLQNLLLLLQLRHSPLAGFHLHGFENII